MISVQREEPPRISGERQTLTGFLQLQRETLAWKCSELSAAQLRQQAVPTSKLSLLGLVRHMTDVERGWFARTLGGVDAPAFYWRADRSEDVDFDVADADVDEAFRLWHEECARSRALVAHCESLDTVGTHQPSGLDFNLRWILIHMIEEYARHNGHADLLREQLDGHTGE
ncbi:DinB family protein [Nocardia sp. NBC_01327]|uniref:DinB family protein n=1 Tax=Nocardia sp. NBC_01327 TaxID=2903593 RepID=UPI002E0E8421|nr:DinB family protein [Nocardia sp. NBC_01327]